VQVLLTHNTVYVPFVAIGKCVSTEPYKDF
jgi:hypothetical protein